jgi:hypothetical protein
MKQKKRFETEIEWSLKVLNPGAKKSVYKDITILRGFKTIRGEEKPMIKVYKGKSTKPIGYYYYPSNEKLEESLKGYKSRADARETWKEEKKAEKSFIPMSKVGDVFCDSWGYDQTNIDYYEIIERPTTHYAIVKRIESRIIETNSCGDYVVSPSKGCYSERYPKEIRVKLKKGYNGDESFRVNSFSNASACDENERNYETGSYNGH